MSNKASNAYWESFKVFFKIGLFTIGGGYAMLPLVQAEVVEKRKWVEREEYMDILAVSQSAPGVFAVNISIFIGYKLNGFKGSLITTLGTILPSFLIILAIALFFQQFKEIPLIERIFKGIRPAVVALIAVPTFQMARSVGINRYTLIIPLLSALLIWLFGVSPIYIILIAGLGGWLYGRLTRS